MPARINVDEAIKKLVAASDCEDLTVEYQSIINIPPVNRAAVIHQKIGTHLGDAFLQSDENAVLKKEIKTMN